MSLIVGLFLIQSATTIGTVPVRNAELDGANDCLVAGTQEWLTEFDWNPEADERWRWALKIVDKCEDKIEAAADTKGAVYWSSDVGGAGITSRQMLRSEALYYVDGMIRAHFEPQPEQQQ